MAPSQHALLEHLANRVASHRCNPLLLRLVGKAIGLVGLVLAVVFVPMAIVKREPMAIGIPALVVAAAAATVLSVLLIHAVFWRRSTLGALRAAMTTPPVLMTVTERHGLFFLDQRGYFVERPDLAYQPYSSLGCLVHGIAFREESHELALSLSTVSKGERQQRTIRIELPRSLAAQQVRAAVERIEGELPRP